MTSIGHDSVVRVGLVDVYGKPIGYRHAAPGENRHVDIPGADFRFKVWTPQTLRGAHLIFDN